MWQDGRNGGEECPAHPLPLTSRWAKSLNNTEAVWDNAEGSMSSSSVPVHQPRSSHQETETTGKRGPGWDCPCQNTKHQGVKDPRRRDPWQQFTACASHYNSGQLLQLKDFAPLRLARWALEQHKRDAGSSDGGNQMPEEHERQLNCPNFQVLVADGLQETPGNKSRRYC